MNETAQISRMMTLAEQYGTPLYVYDLRKIQEQIARIKEHMHPAVRLFYSMKANPNTTLVKQIYDTGTNLEICSLYEWKTAQAAGASPERIMYLGPGKSRQELARIIDSGIRYVIAESLQELEWINQLAREADKVLSVGVRVNPNVAVKGARLQMGGTARQFGIDENRFAEVVERIAQLDHLRLVGIHTYHGTRILAADAIAANMQYILSFADQMIRQFQLTLDYVGVGGGLGVPYFPGESEMDMAALGRLTHAAIDTFLNKHTGTSILMESGRYIVAEAGTYLARVMYTKTSQGIRFAVTDGGTHHHMAAGGTGNVFLKNFPIQAFVNEEREVERYHLSGPLCTPNDLIGKNVSLPKLQPGDLIGILRSGAYGLTASPVLFLSHGLPREVLYDGDQSVLIRERDEYMVPQLRVIPQSKSKEA